MKICARILSIFLVISMLIAGFPLVAQAHSFVDVDDDEFLDAINYIYDNGLVAGITTTTFEPDTYLTRAMFITILYRYAGEPQNFANVNFEDVPAGRYYTNAVRWGVYAGIISGMTDTTFEPHTKVQKQQVATFLYRFANYLGYNVSCSGSLSCSDANKIFNYAKVPMSWAVENGVFDDSYTQNPTSWVARKYAAQYICRFGYSVEGIRSGVDNFSFVNASTNFQYRIPSGISKEHYNELIAYIGRAAVTNDKEYVDNMISGSNLGYDFASGACYGMSMCVILDKLGKIDFNGNFCNNVSTMYQVPKPKDTSSKMKQIAKHNSSSTVSMVESAICYYQLVSVAETTVGITANHFEPIVDFAGRSLEKLRDEQSDGGLGLLCYSAPSISHAIVVYGKPRHVAGYYIYSAYDNRYPNDTVTVHISDDFKKCKIKTPGNIWEEATEVLYSNDFDQFDNVDIDGPANEGVDISALSMNNQESRNQMATVLSQGKTLLYIDTDKDFSVTNAEGDTLIYADGAYSGTMKAAYVRMIPMGNHALRIFVVEDSQQFEFTASGTCLYMGILSDTCSQGISSSAIDSATMGEQGVSLSGSDMGYWISQKIVGENQCYSVSIRGDKEESVALRVERDGLVVESERAESVFEVRESGCVDGLSETVQPGETVLIFETVGMCLRTKGETS